MSGHSIRLRLVDWLKSFGDHVTKKLVQELRCSEVHSHSADNIGKAVIVALVDARPEGQGDNAASMPRFQDEINKFNARAIVANVQPPIANRDFTTGSHNYFLNHQKSPIGTAIDCSELNRHAAGQIMPTRKPGVES